MALIEINFDKQSLQKAIKQVRTIKNKFKNEIPKVFLRKCLVWVRERANDYLWASNVDKIVVNDILSKWEISTNDNVGKLINKSNKAVYIEFGVGLVGLNTPHPNSQKTNYEYNVKSGKKDYQGRWRFTLDENQGLDLLVGYYNVTERKNSAVVSTTGSPSNLYLYNAIMDLVSTGTYKILWKETLKQEI